MHCGCFFVVIKGSPLGRAGAKRLRGQGCHREIKNTAIISALTKAGVYRCAEIRWKRACPLRHCFAMPLPGLRLSASASLPLASCWPRPQQLLPVSATGGGRRRCSQRERLWQAGRRKNPLSEIAAPRGAGYLAKFQNIIDSSSQIELCHVGKLKACWQSR